MGYQLSIREMEEKANAIRQDLIRSLVQAGSGHSAGPLGIADVFTAIYFSGVFEYDPVKPQWEGRDYFVLSNGHICPILYVTLAHAGFFDKGLLDTLRKLGSPLQGHPHRDLLPGLETSSGPLGSGLSQAAGMAYALRMDGRKNRVVCVCSDGEHQEGNFWEGMMFAGHYKLSNLTVIVDRNNIQIDGYTEEVMALEPLRNKYEAFNWQVLEIDGHNMEEIVDALNAAKAIYEKPTMILAHTIPGKGVEFMEGLPEWHGNPPNVGQAVEALKDLRTLAGKIESEHE